MWKIILFTHYNTDLVVKTASVLPEWTTYSNTSLSSHFLEGFFSVFHSLKNWCRMFLIYCLAFFNILHSCWRQCCLTPSQYWYQNIKSYCQVSWYSNLLTRTRYKGLSFSLSLLPHHCDLVRSQDLPGRAGPVWYHPMMEAVACWCWDPTDVFVDMLFFQKYHFIYLLSCWDHSSFTFVWHKCSVYYRKGKPYQLRSEGQYSLTFVSPSSHWQSEEANSYSSKSLGDRLGRKMAKTEPQLPKQAVQIRASPYNQCHIIKLPRYQ